MDIAAPLALLWLLAVARVTMALRVGEGANRTTDVAWIVAIFAPLVLWEEIAAQRRRSDHGG